MQLEDQWSHILTFLPDNLEESSKKYRALLRKRKIKNAEDFLRMILAYAATDLSLQNICSWALTKDIANLSKTAFFYKVRDAKDWLLFILKYLINTSNDVNTFSSDSINITIVDATHIQGPGSIGTEWRIHTHITVDKSGLRWFIKDLYISDEKKAESFQLYKVNENDLVIGDRAYSTAKGINSVKEKNAEILVRFYPNRIKICDLNKIKINFKELEQEVQENTKYSKMVYIPIPPKSNKRKWQISNAKDWIKSRLIGFKIKKDEMLWLLTTVPHEIYDDEAIINIYRLRWQIELLFKRLKSLAWINKLPSPHKGPTACSWIIAKLIIALLADIINKEANKNFFPSG